MTVAAVRQRLVACFECGLHNRTARFQRTASIRDLRKNWRAEDQAMVAKVRRSVGVGLEISIAEAVAW